MSVELETFLGEWKDSFGNDVSVDWAKAGSRGGQLSVVLTNPKSSRPPIRLDVKSTGSGFTCGHYDLDTEKSSEECIVWLDTRRSGKSSVWKRDGVKRSCSRSRSAERHAAGKRAARQRRGSRSRSRSRGRRPKDVDSAPGNWGGSRYGLPSPAVYWAQAAPGWVPELPRVSRSAAASEGPTPGAWVPPSMEKRESPDADPDPPSQLALPAPNLAGGPDDFLGAPLMPRMPIAHAAPVKVLPPPPLVDEMEEFDKLLLQIEAHDNGGSILARSAASTAKPAKEAANGQGDVGASHRPAKSSQEEQLERREFERERIQREEREKAQREKEQKESEQREKEQRAIQQREEEKKRLEKSQPVPKVRQRGLPAPRQGSAVKVELIEDEKDQVAQPAQAPQREKKQGPAATSDPARDPRTRPSRSNDPRLQDDDAETTVKVLVDPYLEHVEPEEETALSVEVLRQPKAQAIPKRQRKAAPKKAIAKHPPSAPLSTPLTPAPFQEKKLLEIKQLLQRETQPMAPTTPPPKPPGLQGLPGVCALPGLPGPPMAPITPRTPSTPMTPAPAPEDDAQKRLMAYSMLLLGGGEDDNEEAAPWKKKRRRAVGVDL